MNLREIDRLVAEKVMGWVQGEYAKDKWYYKKNGQIEGMAKFINDWNPSTNIADAWQVVEKMKEMHFSVRGSFIFELQREVTPKELKDKNQLVDLRFMLFHLTPKAICLAALKAVGVEVKGMELREKGICPTCKGKGSVDVYDNSADDVIPVPCPDCCEEREGEE